MIATAPHPASILPLMQQLRRIFHAQGRELLSRLTTRQILNGAQVDLSHWLPAMVEICKPIMLPQWQSGILQGRQQLRRAIMQQRGHKAYHRFVRKDFLMDLAANPRTFSLVNPNILDAIDESVMLFCRTTNATATDELNATIAKLRTELKEGLSAGEAYQDLQRRVVQLFADPARAQMIARTETDRALNHGSLIAYQKSNVCEGSAWSTTTSPCPACSDLDGEERPFGEPFAILTKGNPAYRVVMAPPLHVNCYCVLTPVIAL